jgi:hypothetical protein
MSTHTFRLNLTAANFPMHSSYASRSIYSRSKTDTNYVVSNGYSGTYADRDIGIPMPIYMHNVLPTTYGFKSVGYTTHTQGNSASYSKFDKAFTLRTSLENKYLFSPAKGTNYLNKNNTWQSFPFSTLTASNVSIAYLHQHTYICYENMGIYELEEVSGLFVPVSLIGIDVTKIKGICNANNYLIAYTNDTIYWSSAIDPTDFIPSLSTTAGSEQVTSLRGKITTITPIADGFIIHTTANQVTARYTGNEKLLWDFVEISGSLGVSTSEHVAYDSNSELQYSWTRNGLQITDLRSPKGASAIQFMPEISDYLLDTLQEVYIGNTGRLDHVNISEVWASETQEQASYPLGISNLVSYRLTNKPLVKLAYIGNRYLCVSYTADATNLYKYCLVIDSALKRMGKLKIDHVDCFEYYPTPQTPDIFNCLGFLQSNGEVKTVNSATTDSTDSVFIFGKAQHSREKMLTLLGVEIENTTDTKSKLSILTSLDGKNWLPDIKPLPQILTKNLHKYLCRSTGINHSFKIEGDFHLVSIQGTATTAGDR